MVSKGEEGWGEAHSQMEVLVGLLVSFLVMICSVYVVIFLRTMCRRAHYPPLPENPRAITDRELLATTTIATTPATMFDPDLERAHIYVPPPLQPAHPSDLPPDLHPIDTT